MGLLFFFIFHIILLDLAKSVKQNLKIQRCKNTYYFLIFMCSFHFFVLKWRREVLFIDNQYAIN